VATRIAHTVGALLDTVLRCCWVYWCDTSIPTPSP